MCVAPNRLLAFLMISNLLVGRINHAQETKPAESIKSPSPSSEPATADTNGLIENNTENEDKPTQPSVSVDYPGREIDAEWREKAIERIDEYRKAELTVLVTDNKGSPIKEADVGIKLKQHAFRFGTSVTMEFLSANAPAHEVPSKERAAPTGAGGSGKSTDQGASTPVNAEISIEPRVSEEDRLIYREKLFDLFNTASPREESAAADKKMSAWLRTRGFLFDTEPVKVHTVPATFTISNLKSPETLMSELKEMEEETDLPIVARRFSFAVDPESSEELQLQSDYTRDFFTVLFSIPRVREISIDGFWAPVSGVDGWALFEKDWTMRPVGHMYSDLLKRIWSTNEEALTDAAGKVKIRAFIGIYRISVVVGSRMKTISSVLPAGGAVVRVQID